MPKFLFAYRGAPMTEAPSPEQMQAVLGEWGKWIEKFSKSGNIVDAGDGLKETGKLLLENGTVKDGPFMEAKEILGGYSIIQADSYEQAIKIAKECPASQHGSLEIRELAGFV